MVFCQGLLIATYDKNKKIRRNIPNFCLKDHSSNHERESVSSLKAKEREKDGRVRENVCYLLLTFERLSETNWNREWERELFGSSCYRSYVLRVNVRAEIVSVWFKEGDRETEEVYFCEWHKEVCAEIYNESVIPNRPDISDDRSRNDNRLNCKRLLWLLCHCANCDRIIFIRGSIPGLYFHYQCDKMFEVNV